MKKTLLLLLTLWTIDASAQDSLKADIDPTLTFGAYADGYYSWYSKGDDVAQQQHDCIGAYHNNFGLNIAQVTGAYTSDRVRGVATFHFGDIPAITWANNYRFIQEANAGGRLAERLWLDVGFFKTHVGTESFLPKDNLMSIISLGTFYGPFYQSGARLSYDTKNDWHFEAHAINGYNLHIDNNEFKTFGLLVSKKWSDKVYTSYSGMAGQENVGLLDDGYLVYQNVYTNLTFKKVDVQLGVDVAFANEWKRNLDWLPEPLVAGLATVKYHVNNEFAIGLRGEIFSDEQSINSRRINPVVATDGSSRAALTSRANGGMTIYGGTISLEYKPSEKGFFRIESRMLYDPNSPLANYPEGFSSREAGVNPMLTGRTQVMATVGVYFDKTFNFAR